MNAITKPTWTPERTQRLIALHGILSTALIADDLGLTKNAVIGKVNRLKLSRPENNPAKAVMTLVEKQTFTKLWRSGLPLMTIAERCGLKSKTGVLKRVKLLNLKPRYKSESTKKAAVARAQSALKAKEPEPLGDINGGCAWLYGEPKQRNFCGHERKHRQPQDLRQSPYCPHHHDKAYTPAPAKKKRVVV